MNLFEINYKSLDKRANNKKLEKQAIKQAQVQSRHAS